MPEVFSLASGEERPSERVVLVATSGLTFAASLLNSVALNEKKISGTQSTLRAGVHANRLIAGFHCHQEPITLGSWCHAIQNRSK